MSNRINIIVPGGTPPWLSVFARNIELAVQHAMSVPTITTLTLQASTTNVLVTRQAVVDQSGALTATLLNAPAAGNPTKWIAFSDAGTIRKIPTW